jgi:putative hydrolase of the HAD superfamily
MTFLFDIGRVLLDFDFETSLSRLLPADVSDPHERLSRLLAKKDDFESGAIEPDAYIAWALETLGSEATPDDFRAAWRDIFTPNEPMWDLVRALRARGAHRLFMLSNTNGIHCPWVFDEYPEFRHFDGGVLSYQVGMIKPDPAIYHHTIAHCGLLPEETIFIDDMEENIRSARGIGFRCFHYDLKRHDEFRDWLSAQVPDL